MRSRQVRSMLILKFVALAWCHAWFAGWMWLHAQTVRCSCCWNGAEAGALHRIRALRSMPEQPSGCSQSAASHRVDVVALAEAALVCRSGAGSAGAAGSHTTGVHKGDVDRLVVLQYRLGHAEGKPNPVQRIDPGLGQAARQGGHTGGSGWLPPTPMSGSSCAGRV